MFPELSVGSLFQETEKQCLPQEWMLQLTSTFIGMEFHMGRKLAVVLWRLWCFLSSLTGCRLLWKDAAWLTVSSGAKSALVQVGKKKRKGKKKKKTQLSQNKHKQANK